MWRKLTLFMLVLLLIGLSNWSGREALKPGRFPFQELRLRGAKNTQVPVLLQKIAVREGENMLAIHPEVIRSRLMDLPWVRKASVRRYFPGTLEIDLVEKVAVCMTVEGDVLYLMDEYGQRIKPLEKGDPAVMPVIRPAPGEAAAASVVRLINELQPHPWLREILSEAEGQIGQRWVLHTLSGVRLLFSQNSAEELNLLRLLQNRFKILDRKIELVDLRVAGMAVVRPQS